MTFRVIHYAKGQNIILGRTLFWAKWDLWLLKDAEFYVKNTNLP
jgi:uncharacterized membrane protein